MSDRALEIAVYFSIIELIAVVETCEVKTGKGVEYTVNHCLWYRQPADKFTDALPFGNGSFGGMAYSRPDDMMITLNKDTIWSGTGTKEEPVKKREDLEYARNLIYQGKNMEAQDYIEEHLLGYFNEAYMPLGTFHCYLEGMDDYREYRRCLDLDEGVVWAGWKGKRGSVESTTFASFPDDCIIFHLEAEGPDGVSGRIWFDSPLRSTVRAGESVYWLEGEAPSHVVPNYVKCDDPVQYHEGEQGIRFFCGCTAKNRGGNLRVTKEGILFENVTFFDVCLCCQDSYRGYKEALESDTSKLCKRVEEALEALKAEDYGQLKKRHQEDYQALYRQFELELPAGMYEELPTDERLKKFREGEADEELYALYTQYARYLMICSSRPGSQAANLQGIWNEETCPPWSSNYTTNINLEMNYWLNETLGLWQCMEPYIRLLKEVSIQGRETAQKQFFCDGWAACHNVDLWRQTSPASGHARASYWPMGGVWMACQLLTHYEFTGDKDAFREEYYPILKGAAQFCLSWLQEDKDGVLQTCPSTSPENEFLDERGRQCSVTRSSAMDITLIYELFTKLTEAMEACGIEDSVKEEMERAVSRLPELKAGKDGGILEWAEEYRENNLGHRHLSPVYGLYPGDSISREKTPELAAMAEKLIRRRIAHGSGQTGWSSAWLISLFARLGDGEYALKYLRHLIVISPYQNLFGYHPPLGNTGKDVFQIDANFGAAAGVAEMLIQSQNGILKFLPVLPKAWDHGRVSGIRIRGGAKADIDWEERVWKTATIRAEREMTLYLEEERELVAEKEQNMRGAGADGDTGEWQGTGAGMESDKLGTIAVKEGRFWKILLEAGDIVKLSTR